MMLGCGLGTVPVLPVALGISRSSMYRNESRGVAGGGSLGGGGMGSTCGGGKQLPPRGKVPAQLSRSAAVEVVSAERPPSSGIIVLQGGAPPSDRAAPCCSLTKAQLLSDSLSLLKSSLTTTQLWSFTVAADRAPSETMVYSKRTCKAGGLHTYMYRYMRTALEACRAISGVKQTKHVHVCAHEIFNPTHRHAAWLTSFGMSVVVHKISFNPRQAKVTCFKWYWSE